MSRSLFIYPTWLFNSMVSKFCHRSYMVFTPHSLKMLLFLLYGFLTPQFKVLQTLRMKIFCIGNPT